MKHIDLEARLRRTLAAGGLRLDYQPFVDLQTGLVEGIEALVRWHDPERGMVPPDEFIPLAEVTGLIGEISAFVLRTACAEHRLAAGGPALTVAVNISARQFQRGEVVELVRRTLDETRLDPRRLALEITETMAMQDHALTVETLKRLKALGVKVSIDDFGTGYSSLAYLRRFPIDTLKVDRSFVHDISTDASAAGIVGAIIALARELGLRVVAEGVETREQLVFLRRQGCHAAQGYLFARPRPIADLAAAVANVSSLFSELDAGSREAGAAS